MNILRRRGWELPERLVTPEHVFLNRRAFLAAGAGAAASGDLRPRPRRDRSLRLALSRPLNPAFKDAGREVTPFEINATYNNYYEFGTSKQISAAGRDSADPAVVGRHRRRSRKAANHRHRRSLEADDTSKSGSTATAASRPGRWWCPGPVFRWRKLVALAKPLSSCEVCALRNVQSAGCRRGPEARSLLQHALALYRRRNDRRGRQ